MTLISESYDGKSRAVHIKFAFSAASYHSGKLPWIGIAKAIHPSKLRELNHSSSFFCGLSSQCKTKLEANKYGFLDHLGNPLFKSQSCLTLFLNVDQSFF